MDPHRFDLIREGVLLKYYKFHKRVVRIVLESSAYTTSRGTVQPLLYEHPQNHIGVVV